MRSPKVIGVYAILTPSGRRYIGSSVDVRRRWRAHLNSLRCGTHENFLLQRAYAKYGHLLVFTLLETCSRDLLHSVEQIHLDAAAGCRLNLQPRAGAGGSSGYKYSAEQRAAMGAARKGTKRSAATRERMRQAATGRPHTDATRAKISAAKRGTVATPEHRSKLRMAARPGKSGLKGVVPNHCGWQAQLKVDGKLRYLGTYKSPALAYWTRFVYIECMVAR